MSDKESGEELTRSDLFDKLAGKAKEAAGEVLGDEELAEEGRGQQIPEEPEAETDESDTES